MKGFIKKYWSIMAVILLVVGYLTLGGYRFTMEGALNAGIASFNKSGERAVIMASSKVKGGAHAAYEIKNNGQFGSAKMRRFGPLWQYGGGALYSDEAEGHKPFIVIGSIEDNIFYPVVKAFDPQIKYIAVGADEESYRPGENYDLRYEDVVKKPEVYRFVEVQNGYAALGEIDFSEENYTTRAFDENGKVIGDSYYGWGERYLNKPEEKRVSMSQSIRGYMGRDGRVTLYISRYYKNSTGEEVNIKDSYVVDRNDLTLTSINIVDKSEGMNASEKLQGIEILGTVKDHSSVSFVVEGIIGLTRGGWNSQKGEKFRVKFPVYNETSDIPLDSMNIDLSLTQMASDIRDAKLSAAYNSGCAEDKKLYITSTDTTPRIYFQSSSLDDLKAGDVEFLYYVGEREYEKRNTRWQYFYLAAIIGLIISNILLWKKLKKCNN